MPCIRNDTCQNRIEPEQNIYTVKDEPNRAMKADNLKDIYHERQSKELCALHALNNLFQDPKAFSKSQLDKICFTLSPDSYINPHKSIVGLGNYDVNVLMYALQVKEYETVWFDKRKDVNNLILKNIFGFILNIPTDLRWGYVRLPFRRKHWICLRQIRDNFFNLDSKLDTPQCIGTDSQLRAFLQEELKHEEKELLLVVTPDVSRDSLWYHASSE